VVSFNLDKYLIKVLTVINSVVLVPGTIEMMPVLTLILKTQRSNILYHIKYETDNQHSLKEVKFAVNQISSIQ
jgi:hypothetical protein